MDLFEQEKRMTLRPVKALGELLERAFAAGACTCIRCRKCEGAEEGYLYSHTFGIDGMLLNRRFASSSQSDVRGALCKAWEAYYKTDLPDSGPADIAAISALVEGRVSSRLMPLLYAAPVIKDIDGKPHFIPGI
ncbi:hypothetical protein QAO71_17040 (plasmid) [Halopseudomonas sp. SMJS2]|uniref:hypothetical protein n=1 Tax=Halopseudomonas sp. SMJS2 TaxID=3041098 RepID=UPI002452948D|nr:hypothetical protein [Halopseudomonas sp. SMJS2]WGK63476.1 hypothetical protein QAO71_17040 [Halopseudomonas sp. SMJS2]